MKNYVSVFSLFARCSIYKVLALLGLMIGGETAWFLYITRFETTAEAAFDLAHLQYGFAVAAVLITIVLMRAASAEQTRYTLDRLQVRRGAVLMCQGLYNVCVYLLLWVAQALTVALLCKYFLAHSEGVVQSQDFALAIYRHTFLHSLLPMAETMLWVRNVLLALSLGFAAAHFSLRRRLGTVSYTIVVAAVAAVLFVNDLGFSGGEFVSICISFFALWQTFYQTRESEELEI